MFIHTTKKRGTKKHSHTSQKENEWIHENTLAIRKRLVLGVFHVYFWVVELVWPPKSFTKEKKKKRKKQKQTQSFAYANALFRCDNKQFIQFGYKYIFLHIRWSNKGTRTLVVHILLHEFSWHLFWISNIRLCIKSSKSIERSHRTVDVFF